MRDERWFNEIWNSNTIEWTMKTNLQNTNTLFWKQKTQYFNTTLHFPTSCIVQFACEKFVKQII